jgi:hypothetical protein
LCKKSSKNEPPEEETPEKLSPEIESPEENNVPGNHEISIHYVSIGEIWDRNEIIVDSIFSFKIALVVCPPGISRGARIYGTLARTPKVIKKKKTALNITRSNDAKVEPQIVEECGRRNDWPKWNSDRAKLMSKI